jgi:hypothetical protein
MQKTFIAYNDPSHGWGKIPLSLINEIGISKQISFYSYVKGDYAYLEEDADLTLFIESYEKKFGFKPKFNDKNCDNPSRIRTYPRYSPF